MNKLILILISLFVPVLIMSQNKAELGLLLGGANYQGDIASSKVFSFDQIQAAGGIYTRFHLNRHITLRGNIFYTKLKGDDLDFADEESWRTDRGFNFTNPVYEFSFTPEVYILGNTIKRKMFRPYILLGIGAAFTNPKSNLAEKDIDAVENEPGYFSTSHFSVPMGFGINMDVNDKFTLGIEASCHFPLTDYLDGISESANPDKKDWFAFGGITLGYKFGEIVPTYVDTDGDGVNDDLDLCPLVSGKLQGCPDSDSDGIADLQDACPNLAGDKRLEGCPDSDFDGIADINDSCPDTPGIISLNGCPDFDEDGIADEDDTCPTLAGTFANDGCPDTDGDGIYDIIDNCPNVKGNLKGCPDTDLDGVIDAEDFCPLVAGNKGTKGCPDSDADGVADVMDDCPYIAGVSNNRGCPEVGVLVAEGEVEETAKTNTDSINDIYFSNTRAKISKNEITKLDKITKLMIKDFSLNLKIRGHTDDTGDIKLNDHLSMRRARRCYKYLASKGIALNRMSFEGFGEMEPKYDNSTEDGKKMNRRVEFAFLK